MTGCNDPFQLIEYLEGHKKQVRAAKKFLAARKKEAWEKVRLLAKELPRLFPLQRIYLLGSLVKGDFSAFSDIDIAVEGLAEKDHLKLLIVAENLARPFRIDVILLEEAPLSLQKKIHSEGVVVYERRED